MALYTGLISSHISHATTCVRTSSARPMSNTVSMRLLLLYSTLACGNGAQCSCVAMTWICKGHFSMLELVYMHASRAVNLA